jgi:hypothetical protein
MRREAKKFHENQYLGGLWQLEGAAQNRVFRARHPIGGNRWRSRGNTTAAPELGVRKHFGKFRLISRGQQDGSNSPPGR